MGRLVVKLHPTSASGRLDFSSILWLVLAPLECGETTSGWGGCRYPCPCPWPHTCSPSAKVGAKVPDLSLRVTL